MKKESIIGILLVSLAFFERPDLAEAATSEATCQEAAELLFTFGPMLHDGTVTLEVIEDDLGYTLPSIVRMVTQAALIQYEELKMGQSEWERRAKTYDLCAEYLGVK